MFNRYIIKLMISVIMLFGSSFFLTSHTLAANLPDIYGESPSEINAQLIIKTIEANNPNLSNQQKNAICLAIIRESMYNDFDPLFISAIIATESSFVPKAVSPCAAQGLMQITACVADMMNINNPFDIQENIYAGTRYLKDLQQVFRDNSLTLAAYNAGPTLVARLGRIPKITETILYVKKVQEMYYNMREESQIAMSYSVISFLLFNPKLTTSSESLINSPKIFLQMVPTLDFSQNYDEAALETRRNSLFGFIVNA